MEMRVFAALIRDAPALRYTPSEYAAAILARCLILLKGGKKKENDTVFGSNLQISASHVRFQTPACA